MREWNQIQNDRKEKMSECDALEKRQTRLQREFDAERLRLDVRRSTLIATEPDPKRRDVVCRVCH